MSARFSLAVGLLLVARAAGANGRYPAADQFSFDPVDPDHFVVRSTFGLLQSFDRGATWSWVCEPAISGEILYDPPVALTTAGTVVALATSVSVGDRTGCRWTTVTQGFDHLQSTDIVVDPSLPSRIYASQPWTGPAGLATRVVESIDGGRVWAALGGLADGVHALTIEVAPSRPERLYIGGPDATFDGGVVAVSDDRGSSWTSRSFPGVYVYVSGVDPVNPDRVYARLDGSTRSQLFVTENAGTSWSMLFDSPIGLKGFAISPDGSHVAVGGDQGGVVVFTRSSIDGGPSTFTRAPSRHATSSRCLKWGAAGLFACADEGRDGFTVGLSSDGSAPFVPLLRLYDLAPVSCEIDASSNVCSSVWCAVRMTLPIDAGCGPDRGGPDAGMEQEAGTGADSGNAVDTSAPGAAGCGCRAHQAKGFAGWHALVLVFLAGARLRRRANAVTAPSHRR